MSARSRPPFRADQVGSLLRPEALKQAREQFLGPQTPQSNLGPHDNAALRAVEDRCIRECIAMQERIGLQAVTDGEFRRRSWWLELVLGWEGFEADRTGSARLKWRNESGVTQGFSELRVKGKIRWRPSSVVRAFQFLKSNTQRVSKVTMPAPNCAHYYTGGNLGGYDPVAEVLFNQVDVDGYFLEYDSSRAGGFEPLRFLPKGKQVVLGLVSSKTSRLEDETELLRRIEAAARFAPLEQLCLSPQCGFASSIKGNPLTHADQEAKLRRVVEVAGRVWGR